MAAEPFRYGDRLVLSQSASGNSSYYIHDRNGNVRNIINSSQTVLNSYSYTAYGEDIASQCFETVPNNWKFSGQYHDKQLDQYYLRARMYSPYLARFNGYDPVLGDYQEPLTLHQYLYCLNDPVNRVDLSGEFSLGSLNLSTGIQAGLKAMTFRSWADTGMNWIDQALAGATAKQMFTAIATDVGKEMMFGVAMRGLRSVAKGVSGAVVASRRAKYSQHLLSSKGIDIDALSAAAKKSSKNGASAAGRSFQKHVDRVGGYLNKVYSGAKGRKAYNQAGEFLTDDVLTDPKTFFKNNNLGGIDAVAPDGLIMRFDKAGEFYGFMDKHL